MKNAADFSAEYLVANIGFDTAEKEPSEGSLNECGQNRRCRGCVQVKKNRKAGAKKAASAAKKKGIGLLGSAGLDFEWRDSGELLRHVHAFSEARSRLHRRRFLQPTIHSLTLKVLTLKG